MTAPRTTAAALLGALALSLSVGPAAASPPNTTLREHRETRSSEPRETPHGPPASSRSGDPQPSPSASETPSTTTVSAPAAPTSSGSIRPSSRPSTPAHGEGPSARHGDGAHARRGAGETGSTGHNGSSGSTTTSGSATSGSTTGSRSSGTGARGGRATSLSVRGAHGPPASRRGATGTGTGTGTGVSSAGAGSSGSAGSGSADAAGSATALPAAGSGAAQAAAASSAASPGSGAAAGGSGAATPSVPPASPGTATHGTATHLSGHAPRRHSARVNHRRRGRGRPVRAAFTRGAGHAVTAGAPTLASPRNVAPLVRHSARRARRSGSSAAHNSHSSSPLITTVTRIVNVVPVFMRLIIALLVALALALAARSRFTAVRARRLERQRRQLLDDVGLLQAALLPDIPSRLGAVSVSAAYRPAEGPGAGGDFYDLFALPDGRLAVLVGDVSGHGRAALPHTALIRFTLRAYLEAGLAPRVALDTAAAILERQLSGAFATVLLATYDPSTHTLVYASAGHPPPLVLPVPSSGDPAPAAPPWQPLTVSSAPPLGIGLRTGTRQTTLRLCGPSLVCLHTDGLTEARLSGDLFGERRLSDILSSLGPSATASLLLDRVAAATDARPDDMAACLLYIAGATPALPLAKVGPGEDIPAGGGPLVLSEELVVDRDDALSHRTTRFLLACGLDRAAASRLQHSAHAATGRARTAVLHASPTNPPRLDLRHDDVAVLVPPPHVPPAVRVGASL